MNNPLPEEIIREIESQLSCPSGEAGIAIGKNMNQNNMGMTLSTINWLQIQDDHSVLELGHGNCGHLPEVLNAANEVKYTGLEISETMWQEAKAMYVNHSDQFHLYDGETIPFDDATFDRVMSVNTVYFWANPIQLIQEIERSLKPNGICVLTYADKEFMEKLPFVRSKFTLFDKEKIETLVLLSELKISEYSEHTENTVSKSGEAVERSFTMVKLIKATK